VDPGPAAILAAELYCRQRGAMLIVDPPVAADDADGAVNSISKLGYDSPNIVSYFPRMRLRRDHDQSPRVVGGALAGLLCKLDRTYGPWHRLDVDALCFDRNIEPCHEISEKDVLSLSRAGINAITTTTAGRSRLYSSITMSRGSESHRVFASLSVRRLCLRVINTIDLATRWTMFEKADKKLTERIQRQVRRYFADLYDIGAFATERYVVQCDAGLANRENRLEHGVTILLVFQPTGSGEPISFTLHQTVLGCRVATTAFAPVAQDCA
ncbi:MAG: hypothetical protein OER97_05660, partial [Gammaproteobacteria bacterium]|nr:hypothetical protein [Gammaproteobacteria bacterium]